MTLDGHTVKKHFVNSDPSVKASYAAILKAARKLGPVTEDPKKTSIHLSRRTAFAGIATRKSALVLTLKSHADVKSRRIMKREQVSKNQSSRPTPAARRLPGATRGFSIVFLVLRTCRFLGVDRR